jgi:diguanylate cyclase (GGDEF)-like protein
MMGALIHRGSNWLPTVLVLAVVLLAGSRLVMLSLERHAEDSREQARAVISQQKSAIETQLVRLAEAATALPTSAGVPEPATDAAATAGRGAFRIGRDGTVGSSGGFEQALASEITSEWKTPETSDVALPPGVIGTIRHGSQWIVAARVPIVTAEGAPAGWSIAWAELDRLLASAQLGGLIGSGYDFTLSEVDAATGRVRPFVFSGPTQLVDPERIVIRLPPGFLPVSGGGALELAVRPQEGWYPMSRLATQVGLLALVAWLVAFGTHDLLHRSRHLSEQLAAANERHAALGEQLMMEVEERQDLQKSYEHARFHDAFTGLPNRRYFMDQLDRTLRDVRSRRRQGASVAVIDIDRFRLITDTLGHTAGDELMVQASQRFERALQGTETVLARLEGSQLALLLIDVLSHDAARAKLMGLQSCLQAPFELRRHRMALSAHAGVSCADCGLRRAEELLREADIALSAAKRSEGVRVMAYSSAMGGDAASLVSLEADLHLALERKELRLLFQPIVDLNTGRTAGAEALLRWQHPVEGVLRPDAFLSIAEEAGLMIPITRWIVARVCRLAHEWRMRLDSGIPFYVSINLSAGSLRDPQLVEYVADTLARAQVPASTLKFEITEAGLLDNVGEAREVLRRLHELGIQLMLDDFGTGYSSLNHLELFPFDYVKIDRPFASRAGAEDANRGIMAAVVQIASSLGLKAIAEVIETQPVAQALQQMGCDFAQGNFFGVPVEAEEALQRLRGATPAHVPPPPPDDDNSPTLVLPAIIRSRT